MIVGKNDDLIRIGGPSLIDLEGEKPLASDFQSDYRHPYTSFISHRRPILDRELHNLYQEYYINDKSEALYTLHAKIIFFQLIGFLKNCPDLPQALGQLRKINKENFAKLINENEATYCFHHPESHHNAPIFSFAAQRLRAQGKVSANIVIALADKPGDIQLFKEKGSKHWQAYIQAGLIVATDGSIYYGKFPKALKADCIDTLNDYYNARLESFDIKVLNPEYTIRAFDNKALTRSMIYNADKNNEIKQAKAIVLCNGHYSHEIAGIKNPEIKIFLVPCSSHSVGLDINSFFDGQVDVVVKPNIGSLGNGVTMLSAPYNASELQTAIDKARRDHDDEKGVVIIEEWLKSYPLYDDNGSRLDWTLRVLGSQKGSYAIEARVCPWGNIAGKSQGAEIWSLDKLISRLPGIDRKKIETDIEAFTKNIAKFSKLGHFGLDIILNEKQELSLVEINPRLFGGLISLADLETSLEGKLKYAYEFIKQIGSKEKSLNKDSACIEHIVNLSVIDKSRADILSYSGNDLISMVRYFTLRYRADAIKNLETIENIIKEREVADKEKVLKELIQVYAIYGKYSKANQLLKELEKKAPQSQEYYYAKFHIANYSGKYKEALENFSQLESKNLDKQNKVSHEFFHFYLLINNGLYDKAEESINRLSEAGFHFNTTLKTYFQLKKFLSEKESFIDSQYVADLEKLIKINAADSDLYYLFALNLIKDSKNSKNKDYLDKAKESLEYMMRDGKINDHVAETGPRSEAKLLAINSILGDCDPTKKLEIQSQIPQALIDEERDKITKLLTSAA